MRDGWGPVRRMCDAVLDGLPEFSAAVAGFIRDTVPAYTVLTEPEHRSAVELQLRMRLAALAERRPLDAADLSAAAELAAVRAAQGIPVDALIAAFQAGDQEIWRSITEHASSGTAALMPELGRMMFAATSATIEVMAGAHSRVARDIDGGRITLAHQFMELLEDVPEQAAVPAVRLGFDPNGDFVGMVWKPVDDARGAAHEAASALRAESRGLVLRAVGAGRFELLAQSGDPVALVARVADRLGGLLGIGCVRAGLTGARISLADGRIALAGADVARPVARFAERWPELLVLAQAARIEPLIAPAVRVARAQPHLAATVLAYAEAGMSIATTARAVHLHANSVTYRLDRWAGLTGMNPRTVTGLWESVIACRLADQAR